MSHVPEPMYYPRWHKRIKQRASSDTDSSFARGTRFREVSMTNFVGRWISSAVGVRLRGWCNVTGRIVSFGEESRKWYVDPWNSALAVWNVRRRRAAGKAERKRRKQRYEAGSENSKWEFRCSAENFVANRGNRPLLPKADLTSIRGPRRKSTE